MSKQRSAEEGDRLMRQLAWLIGGIIALFVVPFMIYAFYLDRRLTTFEETLQHHPPQQLEVDHADTDDAYQLTTNPVAGQIVYVPAYSHIYHGDGKPHLLTITLSVRNTSLDDAIMVKSIRYFDTRGKLVKSYLDKPVRLPSLGTTEVIVEREDASGGSGANFLVQWYSNQPVTEPIVEAVMIDTEREQGISFARRGSVIREVQRNLPAKTAQDSDDTSLNTDRTRSDRPSVDGPSSALEASDSDAESDDTHSS